MPDSEVAGVVRLRLHASGLGTVFFDGVPQKVHSGSSFEVVDAVTGEVLVMVTSMRLSADADAGGELALVELTELADADGKPGRTPKHGNTFREVYDPETGDVRLVTSTYLLAGVEEVN